MSKKDALGRDDWIRAAFRALSSGGIGAVKVEPIARELKVSKGSFYWHFEGAAAMHAAMLEHWADRSTFDLIVGLDRLDLNPRQKLATLVDLATDQSSMEYGELAVEAALREWARVDAKTARVLMRVERARLDFLAQLFVNCGLQTRAAESRAQMMYAGLIGLQALEANGLADARTRLQQMLDLAFVDTARVQGS